MKKGFTLIELLAVILILGIIALIAIPTVTSVIEDSKKGSLKVTANTIADAAEKQCQIEQMHGKNITKFYSISDGILSSPLDIKNIPNSGSISVDDECNASVAVHNDNYCVIKNGESTIINSNANNCELEYIITPDTEEACFIFDSNTRTITGYNFSNTGCPNSIVIPSTINNVPVENIGNFAFVNMDGYIPLYYMVSNSEQTQYSNFADIVKENAATYNLDPNRISLIKTDSSTIKSCYKESGERVQKDLNYIGTSTDGYLGCHITSYNTKTTLGNIELVDFTKATNLKTIGDGAFMNNRISTIYFDNSIFTYIGNSVFSNNLLSSQVNLAGFNYTKIPNAMFANNSITNVIYNNNILSIGKYAFYINSIVDYNLPSSLTSIDIGAFYCNNYNSANKTAILNIPDNVTLIAAEALRGNNIDVLNLGKNLKTIEFLALNGSNIKTVNFNEGLENIGFFAFSYNIIEKISLPSSIKNLGNGVFNYNNIATAANGSFIYKIENGVKDNTTLISVSTPAGSTITIPSSVKTIAAYALQNINFKKLVIPNTVKTIEEMGVGENLVSNAVITIGTGVTSIAPDAFYCSNASYCNHKISINRLTNSISGAPWGNSYATITWTGTS